MKGFCNEIKLYSVTFEIIKGEIILVSQWGGSNQASPLNFSDNVSALKLRYISVWTTKTFIIAHKTIYISG